METYIDVYISSEGEKASVIHKKLEEMNLKPTIGDHDYVYNWDCLATIEEELKFIEKIQSKLKGTGVILKFKTMR
jgi:hypothetical protein